MLKTTKAQAHLVILIELTGPLMFKRFADQLNPQINLQAVI